MGGFEEGRRRANGMVKLAIPTASLLVYKIVGVVELQSIVCIDNHKISLGCGYAKATLFADTRCQGR